LASFPLCEEQRFVSEKSKQRSFFIQDPFTEEVQGPLDTQQLKRWYATGGLGEWGVSQSPNGPWTPAADVKGLAVPKAPETTPPQIESAPPPPTPTGPPEPSPTPQKADSFESLRENVLAAIDLAKQHFPESLIGRVLICLVGLWLVGAALFGIGVFWHENFGQGAVARKAMQEADAQAAKVGSAWQELYSEEEWRKKVISDAEYERAKRELSRKR